MPSSAFGEGWQAAWSGDPSAARAWHISGIRASVRGERHGLPMIRLDGQRLVNRRQWDIEALRIEALAVALVGFDPLHPALRFTLPQPDQRDQPAREPGLRQHSYWLTEAERQQIDALLARLRS